MATAYQLWANQDFQQQIELNEVFAIIFKAMNYNYSSTTYQGGYKPKDKDQPLDSVSAIIWDPYKQQPGFITSSWDGYLRYYLVKNNGDVEKAWQIFLQHPVICCDITENNIVLAGLASGDVVAVSLENSAIVHLGVHDAPINGCLITLGFDNLIKFWTLQGNSNNACQLQIKLPLKTITSCYDFPYLVIGSSEGSVALITLKNLPNIPAPQSEKDYQKTTIEKFSKFNCSRVLAKAKKVAMGTVDGRCLTFQIKQGYNAGSMEISDPVVSRCQKKGDTRTQLYGQVDCVDIGYQNYETFNLIGGSDDLAVYNLLKKSKVKTLSSSNSTVSATTAVRISPNQDYVAYATGTDWLKGLSELENIKKPRLTVMKLDSKEVRDFVSRN